jgi:hypothetical protein
VIRQDYLMRLLEQLGQALARILSLRQNNAYDDAFTFLNRESERLIGIDGAMLEIVSTEAIQSTVRLPEKILVAARILEEIALIRDEQEKHGGATSAAVKAVGLYSGVVGIDSSLADDAYRERIVGFADACAERELTSDELHVLMTGYEILGAYGRAEDILFALLERSETPAPIVAEGAEFYTRLQQKTDDELVAGGLPRGEILDGVAELQRCSASVPE